MKNLKGFTLAEVLITLGIIGVVSAMTIPALINNVRAVKLRSQFNKAYSEVQQAFKLMADNESVSPNDYNRGGTGRTDNYFYKRFIKYFKSGIDCGANAIGVDKNLPCYYTTDGDNRPYKALGGKSNANKNKFDDGQIGLIDGALVLLENAGGRLWISIDINGYNNPPNQWGVDLFTFEVTDDGLIPMGNAKTSYNDKDKYCDSTKSDSMNGITCAEKAVKDPNYFKDLYKNYRK